MAPRKTKKAAGTTSGSGPVTRSKTDPKKEVDVTFYSKLQNYEVSGETQMLLASAEFKVAQHSAV